MHKNIKKFILKNIAKNIRKQRKNAGLTQKQLAERLGKSKRYIVRLERARFDPKILAILKILDILNIKIKQIVDFREIKLKWAR